MNSPIEPLVRQQGVVLLDGGLATELEARGHDLKDASRGSGGPWNPCLWSARLLLTAPEVIRQVHEDYLDAGADCLISASYQASVLGFMHRGLSERQALDLIRLSVRLAGDARENHGQRVKDRRPLVAASVGPYGAYLADGSEYSGDYGLNEGELVEFHRQRWHVLAETDADLLACETIPSRVEAQALVRLLAETPERCAWFSFSCRDGKHISDGTPLADVVAPLVEMHQVVAVGINCTAPRYIPSLLAELRRVTAKAIIVYPNSGETYNPVTKQWEGEALAEEFAGAARQWRQGGATLIGGCCRTGPEHIRALRQHLVG